MIYNKHNETHDKYIQALKHLEKNNKVSEYKKVPDTKEEVAFMKETNHAVSQKNFMITYPIGLYEKIFRRNA